LVTSFFLRLDEVALVEPVGEDNAVVTQDLGLLSHLLRRQHRWDEDVACCEGLTSGAAHSSVVESLRLENGKGLVKVTNARHDAKGHRALPDAIKHSFSPFRKGEAEKPVQTNFQKTVTQPF